MDIDLPPVEQQAGSSSMALDVSEPSGGPFFGASYANPLGSGVFDAKFIVEDSNIDVETYIANYSGHVKINRLIFIASHCPKLAVEALTVALGCIKETPNFRQYVAVHSLLNQARERQGLPSIPEDEQWIDETSKSVKIKGERLESDLKGYKDNQIRETIRMGHNDLGDYYYSIGDLPNALRSYSRTRDFCSTSKHTVTHCLNVIKVALELGEYSHVRMQYNKVEMTSDVPDRLIIAAKLRSTQGLVNLHSKSYKAAANSFLQTPVELGTNYNDVISPRDLALYTTLCGLATFDRQELKERILDKAEFRPFLEYAPEMRQILKDFYLTKYSKSLNELARLKNDLLLDMYLSPHVSQLFTLIRQRALTTYFAPFATVDLARMAKTFDMDLASMEAEVVSLINNGHMNARIDSHRKILIAKNPDTRAATYARALSVGSEYGSTLRTMIMRINMARAGLVAGGSSR